MSGSELPADGLCRSSHRVQRDWLDYNGHMNVAWYLKIFDDAGDRLTEVVGMGESYTRRTGNSWVALESHLGFIAEAYLDDALEVRSRVLAVEQKKLHLFQEMFRDDELLATHEQLGLHFDTAARRGSPFEPHVLAQLGVLCERQQALPSPPRAGRTVGIRRQAG